MARNKVASHLDFYQRSQEKGSEVGLGPAHPTGSCQERAGGAPETERGGRSPRKGGVAGTIVPQAASQSESRYAGYFKKGKCVPEGRRVRGGVGNQGRERPPFSFKPCRTI